MMIAKPKRTQSNEYQGKPHKQLEIHKTIDQQQQKSCLEQRAALANGCVCVCVGGGKCILLAPNLRPFMFCCIKTLSSHGVFLTNAMHHHRETI